MVKVIINLISILLSMISSKLVYCYTAMVSFTVMLLNMIFPSLSKKYNQQSISLDHDELENLQKQISSSFTKVQSCDTFPVSIDASFSSHVALDVIESQNQRYQDYIKFKAQMKKKQNKTNSSNKLSSSNIVDNQFLNAPQAYFGEETLSNCYSAYSTGSDEQCCDASQIDASPSNNSFDSNLENQFSNAPCCYNSININNENCCCKNVIDVKQFSTDIQDLECDAQSKKSVHKRNPVKNYTSYYLNNLNRKYNNKLNAKAECENTFEEEESLQEEDEDVSTEDSSNTNSDDEQEDISEDDHDDLQELNEFHQQIEQQTHQYQNMPIMKQAPFQPVTTNRSSSDYNIELLNQQVIKSQLHNYFNMNFLQIKKLKLDSNMTIHDQLENYCSRKRCPCLKFKRRFQRVRSVLTNKKKLPTIFENFAY